MRRQSFWRVCAPMLALSLAACGGSDNGGSADVNIPENIGDASCVPAFSVVAQPDAVEQYCVDFEGTLCGRAFGDCHSQLASFAQGYSSEADCRTGETTQCAGGDFATFRLDAAAAQACLDLLATSACSLFSGSEPQTCATAVASVPPDSAACQPVNPGQVAGEITSDDPAYLGGHIDTFGVCLTQGQTVTLRTGRRSNASIEDTFMFLFAPDGTLAATDDDISSTNLLSEITRFQVPQSGAYMIVVSGYSLSDTGTYVLTISVQ